MCTENIYTTVYPNGAEEVSRRVDRCHNQPRGYRCADPIVFRHPKTSYYETRLPPTPRMTPQNSPRPTTPRGYTSASDRESDHSRRSGHSPSARQRQRVYTDHTGSSYVNVSRRSSNTHNNRERDQERIIIVDGPPTPRTPPQTFTFPSTAPSSPRNGFQMASAHYARPGRHRDSLRPVIVDERPDRHVHFPDALPVRRPSHRRHPSNNSSNNTVGEHSDDETRRNARRSSRHQYYDASGAQEDDIAAQQRRLDRELRKQERIAAAQAAMREDSSELRLDRNIQKAERIARLNSQIDARDAVPVPNLKRTATGYGAEMSSSSAAVEEDQSQRDLRDAVRGLDINDRTPRRRGTQKYDEESEESDALRRRLEERMRPQRRATVGPGSRRPRMVWQDGMYRWE